MITIEGRFSNIYFEKETIVDNIELAGNIVKIGTNYNEKKSDLYDIITAKPKKNNRGRKPKIKEESKRKKQGTEKYFHSQVTFTFYNDGKKKIYHFKLFVNGSFQIPFITDENTDQIVNKPELVELLAYLNERNIFNIRKEEPIELLYLMSILNNYKNELQFTNTIDNILVKMSLDLMRFKNVLDVYKSKVEHFKYQLVSIMYNPEKFTGLILVFLTPKILDDHILANKIIRKQKKIQKTTIIIFGSCKINISSIKDRDTVTNILEDLIHVLKLYKTDLFY
jgi:TATA-box binding protein (TBP) (component of TFIID and TFIIIB)